MACRTLIQPSTHATEKSFTHLLTTKAEHVTKLGAIHKVRTLK